MDDASRIEIFKQGLRVKFASNLAGLKAYIAALMDDDDGEANDSVLITASSFEGGQSSGTVVFEPMAKLSAGLEVLAEMDPDNTPVPPARSTFADFSFGQLET